jgi:hypothetical protein
MSNGNPLREALAPLAKTVDSLRGLVERDPWPAGQERLQVAQRLGEEGSALLGRFDELLGAHEAARARALGKPAVAR